MNETLRPKHIQSLSGLKAICMLLLFWWHSTIPSPVRVDLGARTCEFLFVASGFLVGYNNFRRSVPETWGESFRYTYKKFIDFWPLHFLCMIPVMLVYVDRIFSRRNLVNVVLNLSFLQAWSPYTDIHFSFNGATWFISALLFCYFLSPMLLRFCKRIKTSCLLFVLIAAVRIGMEYIITHCPGEYWPIMVHTNPFVRSLEFFMGMLCVPLFMDLRDRMDAAQKGFGLMSVLELLTAVGAVYCLIAFDPVWSRGGFVLLMVVICFVFAFDKGILSRLLSCRALMLFSKIQLEFFILHQSVILCLKDPMKEIIPDWRILNPILFLIILGLAILYKRFLREKCSALLDRAVKKGLRILKDI